MRAIPTLNFRFIPPLKFPAEQCSFSVKPTSAIMFVTEEETEEDGTFLKVANIVRCWRTVRAGKRMSCWGQTLKIA